MSHEKLNRRVNAHRYGLHKDYQANSPPPTLNFQPTGRQYPASQILTLMKQAWSNYPSIKDQDFLSSIRKALCCDPPWMSQKQFNYLVALSTEPDDKAMVSIRELNYGPPRGNGED